MFEMLDITDGAGKPFFDQVAKSQTSSNTFE
jgi:hypothetical protein